MHLEAKGGFHVTGWDEKPYREDGSRKLTLAVVDEAFEGGITGQGSTRLLMAYAPDGTAHFTGLQHVDGAVEGRPGTFVLEAVGEFDGQVARWHATVVPNSGPGGLAGLSGAGTFGAPHGSEAIYELEFDLPD